MEESEIMTRKRKTPVKRHKLPQHKSEALTKVTRARQKVRADNKGVPKGKKLAAGVVRREAKKREKQKWQAKQKAKHTGTLTKLGPIAKEINIRLEKAAQIESKADDHRLAAALQLRAAQKLCAAAKIGFPAWVKANVDKSYGEVRKLITVAASPSPAKALADMRAGAAERNRELRKRQKVSRDASEEQLARDPQAVAVEALNNLSDVNRLNLLSATAMPMGMRVVSEEETKAKKHVPPKPSASAVSTFPAMKTAFADLIASDKLKFVKWAAAEIGVAVSGDFQGPETGDAGGRRPGFLSRRKRPEAGASA